MENLFEKQTETTEADKTKEDKERRALSAVREFMMKSAEYRRPHIELSKKSREIYDSWSNAGVSVIHRANIKLPYGFSVIEDQIPKIVQGIVQERPLITFEAQQKDLMHMESTLDDFQDTQLEDMGFIPQVPASVKSLLLDGTLIAKIPYVFEEELLEWDEPVIDGVTVKVVEQEDIVVKHDGPAYESVPFVDFYPDWRVKVGGDIKAMRGCAHRVWRTLEEIKSNQRYKNIDKLEQSVNTKGTTGGVAWKAPYYSEEAQQEYDRLNDNKTHIKNQAEIEIWEYWGLFDTTGKGDFKEYLITIANGDVVLRCDKNPFKYKMKPFVAVPNVVRDGEFYGLPELLAVRGLIREANTIRNANLDQINMSINRMFIADRNAGIKAKQLFSRPNGIIWANDINGLRELPPAQLNGDSVRESSALQADIQNALGMVTSTPQLPQMARTFGRSATGVEFINNVTASRASLKLFMISEWLLKPMYEIMMQMSNQYITDDVWVRTQDPNEAEQNPFTLLPAEAFANFSKFRLLSTIDTGGQENQFNKLTALGQILQTVESTQPGTVDWEAFFEDTGRDLVDRKYKKFIRTQQERQAMQMQQMAVQQAAQQQAGLQAPQPNQATLALPPIPGSGKA